MDRRTFAYAMQLVGIGWYVGFSILLGVLGGRWLDRTVGTLPLFTLLGLLLGLGVALYGAYRMVLPLLRNGKGEG